MVTVVEVQGRRALRNFINYPIKLFKGVKQFSPAIFEDEVVNLTPSKNPASEWCDFKLFTAHKDGKMVGRICGIISHFANNKYNQTRVRFNRIDMIDDIEVTKALINAVEKWGLENGMNEIVGPLGFSDQDKEGLLTKGFEYGNMFATFYHHPYYMKHFEALGFREDARWIENRILFSNIDDENYERFDRISEFVMERNELHLVKLKNKKRIKPYVREVLGLVNVAYDHLYGYVPMSGELMDSLAKQFIPLLNIKYLVMVMNKENKLVALGLSIPSPVFALKKIKGRLFPFGFIRFLWSLKHSKQLDLLFIAVEPELKNSGIINIVLNESMKAARKDKIEYAETGPELFVNKEIQALWKKFNVIEHKERICYLKTIEGGIHG